VTGLSGQFARWESRRIADLEEALAESVRLQSHYARLLNDYDGGERRTFTADSWLARLAELKELKRPAAR